MNNSIARFVLLNISLSLAFPGRAIWSAPLMYPNHVVLLARTGSLPKMCSLVTFSGFPPL